MSKQITATVKVEYILEFHAGPWGLDCKLDQVMKQSQDGAREAAQRVIRSSKERLLKCTKIGPVSIHMPEAT